jgi:hypothetical protein
MNRGIAVFFGLVFALVSILAGGCSLISTVFVFQFGLDPSILMIWLSGFGLSAFMFILARGLLRSRDPGK